MERVDSVIIFVIVAVMLIFLVILFGPPLFSWYQNWKIKRGFKK
jgi:hypothetical protein